MTPAEHDIYVEKVRAMMDRIDKSSLSDLELTEDEQTALAELDPKYLTLMETQLGKFTPEFPDYDYRRAVLEKALAVFVNEILPEVEKAYRYGVETEL
jgi:hypothetical protein